MFKTSTPWFFENSRVPVILSSISPVDINAITLGPLVFSRGKISEITKQHETIHWQQYIETGIIGFVILYFLFWAIAYVKYRSGRKAYFKIPFEQEAYSKESEPYYMLCRKRYEWVNYSL